MTSLPTLTFSPLAESALLIRLDDGRIDPALVETVWALTAALDAASLPGVIDVVPAYATILIAFDAAITDLARLETAIRAISTSVPDRPRDPPREVEIPVIYGGEFGPDLDHVATHTGLAPADVIARHVAARYRVACGGFAPGWDYLLGLPPELATPRLANPRTRIPPGSVGIGGGQTGVYSLETPGGWNLIGRTPLRLFDPARDDPFLLHPGDRVKFRGIDEDDFASGVAAEPLADQTGSLSRREIPRQARNDGGGEQAIRVLQPGMLTTVQDLGRPGLGRFGVAPGGALDRAALILGNRLLANDLAEAGLEITLVGPALTFTGPTVVAITGADLGAHLNGAAVPLWQPVPIRAGDELTFRPAQSRGVRAYLCVAGGFAIDPVMGGRSTDLVGRFGGWHGRALQAGDDIPLREATDPAPRLLRRCLRGEPAPIESDVIGRVVLGPQQDRFTDAGLEAFLENPYTVSTKANRTGIRLTGDQIAHLDNADLVSEGIAHGAVQIPGDGQPIVLLAARQTVGGYVKIATVIGADLDRFAQLRPGGTVRFRDISLDEARAAATRYSLTIGPDAVNESPTSFTGWEAAGVEGASRVTSGDAWNPSGVIRLIEAATAAGVTSLKLEVAAAGLTLELHRGAGGELISDQNLAAPTADSAPDSTEIVAPVLGVVYRRASPDQPLLAAEGDVVAAGQTIALIEVMKTYHEVQASQSGVLTAFLIEDGQFVEYGQPIARLRLADNVG